MVGFIGTTLHVAAWLCAIIFDLILVTSIDSDQAPGAFTYWLWGYITLMIGFVALVAVTVVHAFSSDAGKIPEVRFSLPALHCPALLMIRIMSQPPSTQS